MAERREGIAIELASGQAPKYATLRDYLGVLRRQRWLILLVAIVFCGAAVAYSVRQEEVYEAEAALSFTESSEVLELLGDQNAPVRAPEILAALRAETVEQPETAEAVRERLDSPISAASLHDSVVARTETRTNFVVIQAEWSDPLSAAKIANGYAREVAEATIASERRRFERAATALRGRLRGLSPRVSPVRQDVFRERIGRLEAAAEIIDPVDIERFASPPSSAVSPTPVRDGALGFVLGLTLGLLAAFARDALDRRVRPRDVHEVLPLPIVGHVPLEALGSVAFVGNGKRRLDDAQFEAFRILRANLEHLDPGADIRSIVVTSALPGEGKSTVASSLASAEALAGKRALLVECDLRRPSLARRLGLRGGPGMTEYLSGRADRAAITQPVGLDVQLSRATAAAFGHPGGDEVVRLSCVTAGVPGPGPAELFRSPRLRELLAAVRAEYDVVIIDSPPILSVVDTLELVPAVDAVLMCVRSGSTTREQAGAAKAALDRLPQRPAGLVLTGLSRLDEEEFGYYSYGYAYGPAARS